MTGIRLALTICAAVVLRPPGGNQARGAALTPFSKAVPAATADVSGVAIRPQFEGQDGRTATLAEESVRAAPERGGTR